MRPDKSGQSGSGVAATPHPSEGKPRPENLPKPISPGIEKRVPRKVKSSGSIRSGQGGGILTRWGINWVEGSEKRRGDHGGWGGAGHRKSFTRELTARRRLTPRSWKAFLLMVKGSGGQPTHYGKGRKKSLTVPPAVRGKACLD